MGCSNARLLVQAPLTGEANAGTTNPLSSPSAIATSPAHHQPTDTNNTTTRMHLTGVDLVVERNGSYTLLLTPKTHKQLMPYVLRKKRFRILVDKPRLEQALTSNEPIMENNKELKSNSKKSKQNPMESTLESIEQVATDELEKVKARFVGGRSIDRGNSEDENEYIQTDDEDMIEEIVTTVEQDKDLECKVKKKVETKKTIAQHPETHNTITKVVKTEVTEITRTITINDHHDLERAKRELGIDDVNRLLPSSTWNDQLRSTHIKEKRYEPINEVVTSKDFPSDSPVKSTTTHTEQKPILAESTIVGRGPVVETIASEQKPTIEIKKKKKKSKLCSCTRSPDDEQEKQKLVIKPTEQPKKISIIETITHKLPIDTQIQGQQLVSSDIKQLIIDKKFLLIEYIHSKIFLPSKLFQSTEEDLKARKISSRILDLLRYDRCSSWIQMSEQLKEEYADYLPANLFLQPMINTYENLFTKKHANLLNTFTTIHHQNDMENIQENNNYLNIVQTHINQRDNQPTIELNLEQTIENKEETIKQQQPIQEEQVTHDNELKMTEDIQEPLPIYNEEYLIKMLGDISPHKPITLAEAIAYQYLDVEDPKLGLSNDTIQRIKHLFHPLSDDSTTNLIRIKRSGEHLPDINLYETNSFDKLTETEPFIYQLQQIFEPTLDLNEKQFRSLTEIILNNKDEYDQLQFDIARTSLPIYDIKEVSTNDFSQSDSGYSMTTATYESLASKIKIEFEPINNQDIIIPLKRDHDYYEDEKIDLDKVTQEQLDKYELNQDLIQIIKSNYNSSDKTIGQAILSRELRLDSTDPNDISYLNSLGIQQEQKRILTAFFFPKNTRIIAYSPEPGRFVEAQTTYNPDYPGYKTDTTIIQIQEKQLSSDHLAMQRNIHDDRPATPRIIESEQVVPTIQQQPPKDKTPPPSTPVYVKKRKSSSSGGLLSCFKSKKPKPGTEQQGQPTTVITETNIQSRSQQSQQQITKSIEEKPLIDYSILSDGKRIYIDAFRDRPGMDMSYRPNDFENRFMLPIAKSSSEYERSSTPETIAMPIKSEIIEEEQIVPIQSDETINYLESETPIIEHKVDVQSESQLSSPPPTIIEQKTHVHLEPRPATIEPVDVQSEKTPIVIPITKSEDKTVIKKPVKLDLHGASVDLPAIELSKPGPLPTLPTKKIKKSTGGLCASCFGSKSAEKKKKDVITPPMPATIQQRKSTEKHEEKKEELKTIVEVPSVPSSPIDQPILPKVNIDQFRERNFQESAQLLPKSDDRLGAATEKTVPVLEPHYQSPSSESVPAARRDISIFSQVNIDQFRERTFQKGSESLPKPPERLEEKTAAPPPPPPTTTEEPYYQLPTNEPVLTTKSPEPTITRDTSTFSQVNIDQFKERTLQKGSEVVPKSPERLQEKITPTAPEEPHYQLPTTEAILTTESPQPTTTKDVPAFASVNIDQFKERTLQKGSEIVSKSPEHLAEKITPTVPEEPHYQLPTNETVVTTKSAEPPTTKDTSTFSQVNIDQFKERTLQKGSEVVPKSPERLEEKITLSAPEEFHYQLPTTEPTSTTESTQPTTKNDASTFSQVNIDQFKERTLQKSSEVAPKSPERLEEKTSPSAPEEPHYQLPINEPILTTESPQPTTKKDASIFSQVNIDQFKERTLQKSSEVAPKSPEHLQEKISPSAPEEPHYQLPINEPILTTESPQPTLTKDVSAFTQVNIDQFKERTLQKDTEVVSKLPEHLAEKITPTVPEEPHYQLPTNEPVVTKKSAEPAIKKDASIFSQINIDQFRERTLQKGSESVPKSPERSDEKATLSLSQEPHYQSPTNAPILTTKTPQPTTIKDTSIFSQVNIDQFRERNFQSLPHKSKEPHYELSSGEPVPPVSISEYNTYDIPRRIEHAQTAEKIINNERMIPSTTDIQKSSGDFHSIKPIKESTKTEEISTIKTEIMPNVEIKESKIKKGSSKLPKKKKKSNLFSTFFRRSERKSKVPALDLPSVEHDLSPNNQLRSVHRHESDPLHIPSTDLPKLDLPLPIYDRPEVNMSTGHMKQTSEFTIPVVDFPPIPNLELPESNKQSIESNFDLMKIPNVQLPDLQSTLNNQENIKLSEIQLKTKSEQTPVQPIIETDYAIKQDIIQISNTTTEQQITIIDTQIVQSSNVRLTTEKQTTSNFAFQVPSPEPVLIISKDTKISPPSFDDDVPSPPSKIISTRKTSEKQPIEIKTEIKKKSSTLKLCSCFGNKSTYPKENIQTLTIPKSNLPEIDMPSPSSDISSILKTKEPLRAPSNDLPSIDLTLPSIYKQETEVIASSIYINKDIKKQLSTPPLLSEQQIKIKSDIIEKQPIEQIQTKQSSSFQIETPIMNISPVDLSDRSKIDAYLSKSTSISEQIQSHSDSGLEAIMSAHIHPSSTLGDIQQYSSVSSGFDSGNFDNTTIQLSTPTKYQYDITHSINLTDEIRTKLISQENQLKKSLEIELSKSIDDFDTKKNSKSLDKILTHGIDLIKNKKITTYSELKQKLIIEHKNDAFLVEPVIRSLYYTIENQGLEQLDKPEFPLAIHNMVRLPAKQTYDTEIYLNKESALLTPTPMTKETLPVVETARSCLTCGRTKSKTKLPITSSGLLDERRRIQLNTHRNELGNILRDHIQSSQPPIRKFADHPKEIDKILRKTLILINQPNILSYEQIRNDLKTDYKQIYYLIDPIVDIIRDTFDHCDITQMNEKINLDILDSNIFQTANLYNKNQTNFLTIEEQNLLKTNQLSWLQTYLINKELNEKKLTRKQTKELNKILQRTLEILSDNCIFTWDELILQLQREYPKAHDLCNRSIELIKQSQKDGLLQLQQAPVQEKRRTSSLITEHARQNLKTNRKKIILSLKNFLTHHNKTLNDEQQLEIYLNKTFYYLEEQKLDQFKTYNDIKEQLKKDFHQSNQDKLIEQIVDIIEQAHATNQFDDIEKSEVQTLMKDRLDGKPLVIKEMYVSLPSRVGAYGDESGHYLLTSANGDRTTTSHRVGRGLSWREANERARILFYRGKHPAIHYDEQAAAFDVRMLLETASGGTQEIPVTDSDVHELLNSCGVQWDGVNIISLVDHSEDVVRTAEQAALKIIREKGLVDLRTPSTIKTDETLNSSS